MEGPPHGERCGGRTKDVSKGLLGVDQILSDSSKGSPMGNPTYYTSLVCSLLGSADTHQLPDQIMPRHCE